MTKTNAIVFTQNKKTVTADRYVPHALYVQNEALIKELGGEILKGVGEFRAEFKKTANAKKFVERAITEMSKKEYNATRKSADKGNKKPTTQAKGNKAKGNEMIALKDAEGNEYLIPASALQVKENKKTARTGKGNATAPTKAGTQKKEVKKPTKKGKGNAELTDAGKKALDKMKMSMLNRAASAYSIANGGVATTFSALGKSEKEIKSFIPNAKAGLLKSDKWAKASKTYGLTAEMLG
jgi:hypothetical protein